MEINHFIRPRPLFLGEASNTKRFCFICHESMVGSPVYVCKDCKFYVHKRCAELPSEIDHPFHPQHPLKLHHGGGYYCDSCHKNFKEKPRFRCNTCNFDLDVECALMMPKINPEGEEFIQHFTHQHPMSLCTQDHDKFSICFACKKITSEVVYACIPCDYFLHKSCSELPTPLLHTLHPRHALHLQVNYGRCHVCDLKDYTFKFRCSGCKFSLDVSCWMEYTWKKNGQSVERNCFICSKQHLDSISCVDSKYLLNQTCIWLPKEINHKFHSHKPLQLLAPKDFCCNSCYKWFDTKSCYGCDDCNFHMDVKCALMPSVQYNEGDKYLDSSIPHYFSHQHPLCLITQDFGIICSVCQMTRPSPIYGCLQCEYFIHQSCIELPSEIESPLHGHHKLTMELVHKYCHLCLKKSNVFFFGCVQCNFYIGIECYSLIPIFNVRYAYHEHPLCLVEKSYCEKCDSNDKICGIFKFSNEFQLTQSYLLRCVQCNYNVHLLCGPLPFTIEDKNHLHGLTLTDCVIEDDSDEYYCDICEEERDPRLCVYYCKYCDFVSHVHCVMSEILSALGKDNEQVELRIARDLNLEERECQPCYNASGMVLNLKDILDSLSEDETKKIEDHFPMSKLYGKEDGDYSQIDHEGESTSKYKGSDIIQEFSMYNDSMRYEFMRRIEQFQLGRKYHIQPKEYELEVGEVEDCMITSNFAFLLSALFKKHGDFSVDTGFGKHLKSVIFYLVCRMVDELRRTCLVDFTERQLATWFYYYSGVSTLGFDIDFASPFVGRFLESYMGLQAMKLEGELPNKVALEIAHLESEIERRKSYLLQFKPRDDQSKNRGYAGKFKWRTVGKDII